MISKFITNEKLLHTEEEQRNDMIIDLFFEIEEDEREKLLNSNKKSESDSRSRGKSAGADGPG